MGLASAAGNIYFVYSFIKRLATPFKSTKAFELGIIDENGKLNESSYNDMATHYFRKAHPQTHDFIVGKALICSSKEFL